MIISRELPANYEFEALTESPQPERLPHYYFPGASLKGGRDGILIRVTPRDEEPWIGTFEFGSCGLSGLFCTPDPDQLLVVSRGAAYLVGAATPADSDQLPIFHITDVRTLLQPGLIIIADHTDLYAYGRAGLIWKTDRLCLDDLTILEITDTVIRGEGRERELFGSDPFEVRLSDGDRNGGLPADF